MRRIGFDHVRDRRYALHQQAIAAFGLLQPLLFVTAFGNIEVEAQNAANLPSRIAQRSGIDADLDRRAVLSNPTHFDTAK